MTGSTKGKRARRSKREWGALISRFERSGQGVEAFCRRESISTASFYRWRGLLGAERAADDRLPAVRTLAFVDLGTLTAAHEAQTHRPPLELKLDLGDGLVLHLVRR